MFPAAYGTADQFVVKALWDVTDLPEASVIARMKPEGLTEYHAAVLIEIMRHKAAQNNDAFQTSAWTPRMIDKVLWVCGR